MINLQEIRKSIIAESYIQNDLEKGAKANIGEIREWQGKKVQKQADGSWKEISSNTKKDESDKNKVNFNESGNKPENKKKVSIETYHDSFTSASTNAREYAESKGFEIDEDDWQNQVALGGKYSRSRPSAGKSHTFTVGLKKDGKEQRKALTFTVYGMESGRYELVAYIN